MLQQMANTCTEARTELWRISWTNQYLTVDATTSHTNSAFVLSRLDYCNAMITSIQLQDSQWKLSSQTIIITPILHSVYLLSVTARIQYKVSYFCYMFWQFLFLNTCPRSCEKHRCKESRYMQTIRNTNKCAILQNMQVLFKRCYYRIFQLITFCIVTVNIY